MGHVLPPVDGVEFFRGSARRQIFLFRRTPINILPTTAILHQCVCTWNTGRYTFPSPHQQPDGNHSTKLFHIPAFGSVNIDEEDGGTCFAFFKYNILGDHLDPAELVNAVSAVAFNADAMDDEVVERFGGKRYVDE